MADVRDYSWLLTAVADWLHRKDLSGRIPDWVRMAEAKINRKLNISAKEIDLPLSSEAGSRFVALPSDFASPIQLQSRHIEPRYDFVLLTAEQLPIDDDSPGLPQFWAVDGGNIAFEKPTDQSYALMLRYQQSIYLSTSNPSNMLLQKHPDLYLYGALVHSAPYLRDDPRVATWKTEFDDVLRQVAAEAARSRSMAPLRTDLPFSTLSNCSRRVGTGY
jgi:hypothetical protein